MEDKLSMSVTTTQVLGVVLVITGLMMVAYQMRKTSLDNAGATSNRSGFQLKTTYHGIIVIGFGVFTVIVGYLTGR